MQTKTLIVAVVASSLISSLATGFFIQQTGSRVTTNHPTQDPTFAQDITRRLETLETDIVALQQNPYADFVNGAGPQIAIADERLLLAESERIGDEEEEMQGLENIEVDTAQSTPSISTQTRTLADIRRQRLVAGGFNNEEATWILQAESDVTLQRLYDQYEARRARLSESHNGSNPALTSENNRLRQKLGDDYYERYLEANGWPTKVSIGSVISNSPGFDAGLRAGDQVISYNGQRVFNVQDINNLSARGTPGESVLIEVERNGNPIQITVPRGPIGIVAGRSPNRR